MHTHSHHHTHGHAHTPENFNKIFGIGIILNLLYVVVEFIYGFKADALSLLSDAGHNLSDVLALILAWVASVLGRSKSFGQFTFGLKKTSIIIAFLNNVLLIIALGAIGWEALERLANPEPSNGAMISIVSGFGIIINGITAYLFYKSGSKDLNIKSAFWHMASDAVVSAGVVAGGIIILYTQLFWVDSVISIIIAIIILISTWKMFLESGNLFLGAAPEEIQVKEVCRFLQTQPFVKKVEELHIWNLSTTETALTVHLTIFPPEQYNHWLFELEDQIFHRYHIKNITIQIRYSE